MAKVIQIDGKVGRRVRPVSGGPLGPSHSRVECLQCRSLYFPTQSEIIVCGRNKIPGFLCPICQAASRAANR